MVDALKYDVIIFVANYFGHFIYNINIYVAFFCEFKMCTTINASISSFYFRYINSETNIITMSFWLSFVSRPC